MKETARQIKNARKFLKGREKEAYAFGFINGYLLCQYNHADGIALRTYTNLLAMVERGARSQEIVEYLEKTINKHA